MKIKQRYQNEKKKKKAMVLLQSTQHPILFSSQSPEHFRKSAPLFLQFKTSDKSNFHYLKNLNINIPTPHSPKKITHILSIIEHLKSKGFSDSDLSHLSFSTPSIFTLHNNINPVFNFLHNDLSASQQEARGLILRCPNLLASSATHQLEPTLRYLRKLGIENLNAPTNLNAHLLNTPVEKIASKVEFLEGWGVGRDVCRRFPAIFGYSEANNLRPKIQYLVYGMERGVEEVSEFPQYFGFSLEKRIMPRHLHLKERNLRIALNRMLLWSEARFYAKWK